MIEYYCKVNEAPKESKVDIVAQYLLDEVCSNYNYTWDNTLEGDKDAFRHYAKEIINLCK